MFALEHALICAAAHTSEVWSINNNRLSNDYTIHVIAIAFNRCACSKKSIHQLLLLIFPLECASCIHVCCNVLPETLHAPFLMCFGA